MKLICIGGRWQGALVAEHAGISFIPNSPTHEHDEGCHGPPIGGGDVRPLDPPIFDESLKVKPIVRQVPKTYCVATFEKIGALLILALACVAGKDHNLASGAWSIYPRSKAYLDGQPSKELAGTQVFDTTCSMGE
jgi:hypothetical protein